MKKWKTYDNKSYFYQWDINQKLILFDAVENEEIHFAHFDDTEALVCKTYKDDMANIVVDIPNILLQSNEDIYVYIMDEQENIKSTSSTYIIGVRGRQKPSDYLYEETEVYDYKVLQKEVKDALAQLDESVQNGSFNGKDGRDGKDGADGKSGATFIPSLSDDGTLSWSNDGGLDNPEPIDLTTFVPKNLSGYVNDIGALRVVVANDFEKFNAILDDMVANFAELAPIMLLMSFDDEEYQISAGTGYILLDSGTGNYDDALIIPYTPTEMNFTSKDKDQIEKNSDFINNYDYRTMWKNIKTYTTISSQIYSDGTYLNSVPVREFVISANYTFSDSLVSENLSIANYFLKGTKTKQIMVSQDIIDLIDIVLKVEGKLVDDGYIVIFKYYHENSLVKEEEKKLEVTSGFDKKGSDIVYFSPKKEVAEVTVNYVIGRG